jgi:CheY-like chemotaxis protein
MTLFASARHVVPSSSRFAPLVLIAEDDRDTREIYRACLDLSGFRTAEAHNGRQALTKATDLVPDIIVTDLALPGLDGFELCRELRQNARTCTIPVMAITGYAFADLDARAARAGMARVLIKPCLPDTLVQEVRTLVQRAREAGGGRNAPGRAPSGSS